MKKIVVLRARRDSIEELEKLYTTKRAKYSLSERGTNMTMTH